MVAVAGGISGGSGEETAIELAVLLVGDYEVATETLKFGFIPEEVREVNSKD
jgi:hypothetical protein